MQWLKCPVKDWKKVEVHVNFKLCKEELCKSLLYVRLFIVIWPERQYKVDICSLPMKRTSLGLRNS